MILFVSILKFQGLFTYMLYFGSKGAQAAATPAVVSAKMTLNICAPWGLGLEATTVCAGCLREAGLGDERVLSIN